MRFSKRCLFPAALAVLFLTSLSNAQVGDADVSGMVTDPSAGPVPGAKVSLTNEDSGVVRSTVADNEGRYRFLALAPGRYALRTEAPGFKTESLTGIVLNVGSHVD